MGYDMPWVQDRLRGEKIGVEGFRPWIAAKYGDDQSFVRQKKTCKKIPFIQNEIAKNPIQNHKTCKSLQKIVWILDETWKNIHPKIPKVVHTKRNFLHLLQERQDRRSLLAGTKRGRGFWVAKHGDGVGKMDRNSKTTDFVGSDGLWPFIF